MTLGTTHSVVSHNGNGLTREFNVTFEFHAASDLEVILVTAATGAESQQTQGFHYRVTGGDGGTGQIEFIEPAPAPAVTERVVIRRISPDIQPDDLVDGGALATEPLERRLDVIAARLQELETDIARSLKVTKGSPATALDLNLVGGKNRQLTVASDEQGVIIATGTLPSGVQTSQFGEDWIKLSGPAAGRGKLGLGAAALETIGTSGASVPLLNGNNGYSGTSVFTGDASFNSDVVIDAPFVLTSETLAIDGNGQIAPSKSHVLLSNAGSLGAISVTNHPVGAIVELRPGTADQWPTLQHEAPGSGNIFLSDGVSAVLDAMDKTIWLQRRNDAGQSPGWYEIGRSFNLAIKQWSVLANLDTSFGTEAETMEIPPTTIMIKLALDGVSSNGTDDFQVEIGDAMTYATSSSGNVSVHNGANTNEAEIAGGPLQLTFQRASTTTSLNGVIELVKHNDYNWSAAGGAADGNYSYDMAGKVQLNGFVTRLRISMTGANTFDAGAVHVWVYN